jgi:hypothetical protein
MSLATDLPIILGPLKSERLGLVLGVDLGFQDAALAVSRELRMPRASVVVTTAARNLIRLSKAAEKFESLVIFGSERDPTLHPDFRDITTNLRDLRNKWYPKAKLCLVCDEPHLENAAVRVSLGIFDRVIARLEWGTVKCFTTATGRKGTDLAEMQSALTNLPQLVVQARFQRGDADNSGETEVRAWIKRITDMRPREVHLLNSEARASSGAKKGKLVPKSRLTEIAAEVTKKTGVPVQIFAPESALG